MQRCADPFSLATLGPTSRAIVSEVLVHGPQPRAGLARRLRLSPASLTKATRSLLELGVLQERGDRGPGSRSDRSEGRGRPGVPVAVDAERHQLVGIKITGDGAYAVRTDALGRVLEVRRRSLTSTDVETVSGQIVDVVNELAQGHPVQAVGIGLAGAMARFDDHVRRNLYLGWDDVPLSALVEQRCGLPTVISNDVRALTAGVQWWGPGRDLEDFAVVTTGVGVGVGLVLSGSVVPGPGGAAGMVGHQRIDPSGPVCAQGHRGCASAYLTTAAITAAVAVAHGRPGLTLAQVCDLADAGDDAASRVLADAGTALGMLVADLVNLLDLPAVVLAGDGLPAISRARSALDDALAAGLDPEGRLPQLHVLASDFDEWARGAAVVACQWLLLAPPSAQRASRGRPAALVP